MSKPFKPLLAASIDEESDWSKLRWPLIASPKVDGIRVICHPTLGPVTRSLKPLPNEHTRRILSAPPLIGLDGEIVVGPITDKEVFQRTTSGVMSHGGQPVFTYHVFDLLADDSILYHERLERLESSLRDCTGIIRLHEYKWVHSREEAEEYERTQLERGFEGIMLRRHDSLYKFGRSTLREGHLVKLKRFKDAEAVIIGFEALERNQNPQTRNLLGYAERSSHQAGKVADDLLGALQVQHPTLGIFYIGSGFDVALREKIWQAKEAYLGKTVTFKYQEVGVKDAPRFPIFKGFREDI